MDLSLYRKRNFAMTQIVMLVIGAALVFDDRDDSAVSTGDDGVHGDGGGPGAVRGRSGADRAAFRSLDTSDRS